MGLWYDGFLLCCFLWLHVKLYHAQPSPGCLHSTSASPSTNKTCIYGISAYYRVNKFFRSCHLDCYDLVLVVLSHDRDNSGGFINSQFFLQMSQSTKENKKKTDCFIGSWAWPQNSYPNCSYIVLVRFWMQYVSMVQLLWSYVHCTCLDLLMFLWVYFCPISLNLHSWLQTMLYWSMSLKNKCSSVASFSSL